MREATQTWLEHEYKTSIAFQQEDNGEYQAYQINLVEGVIDMPEQPEPLTKLRRLRRFNLTSWSGGYLDQPHIELLEFNTVIEMEIESHNTQVLNAAIAAAFAKKQTIGSQK